VIALDKTVGEKLSIRVGEKVKYLGSPGTVRDRMAVQIDEIVTEDVEEEDDDG